MKNKIIIIGAIIIAVVGSIIFWQYQNKTEQKNEEARQALTPPPQLPGINGSLVDEAKAKQ